MTVLLAGMKQLREGYNARNNDSFYLVLKKLKCTARAFNIIHYYIPFMPAPLVHLHLGEKEVSLSII